MLGTIAPYLMAFSAMAFAAVSALTLIHTIGHLDPPDAEKAEKIEPIVEAPADVPQKIAV